MMLKKWSRQATAFSNTSSVEHGAGVEQAACEFLCQHDLLCVAKNYRSPFGEIDLIMQESHHKNSDMNTLIFVEVRFRQHTAWGDGADSVDYRKQQKLIRTAEHYLQHHKKWQSFPCRFDVVSVRHNTSDKLNYNFHWIENAFSAD